MNKSASNQAYIKITPIGGVKKIGSNMTAFKLGEETILVDAGILFPDDDLFGLNYLIPDYSNLKDINHIVITHGHEDHIGAIRHVIERFPTITIWAPAFAAKLINKKLKEINYTPNMNIYDRDSILKFGEFNIIPIAVNHSIPDSYGLVVQDRTNDISIFYVSDFKYDDITPFEKPMDIKKLVHNTAKSKVRLLMADSTNVMDDHKTPSEIEIKKNLETIIIKEKGRKFITLFSSNIHRLQTIIDLAQKNNFKIIPMGRSIWSYMNAAIETNHIQVPPNLICDADQVEEDNHDCIYLLTGCQGDFRGALNRVASGNDPYVKLKEGDCVIFSSKIIPGNERKVSKIINSIYEKGAHVYTARDALIHVSGHPGKEDLKIIYDAYKPTDAIPIHGETSFLNIHADFIKANYPQTKTWLLTNHDELSISRAGEISFNKVEGPDPIFIHGKALPIEKEALNARRKAAQGGVVYASITWTTNKIRIDTRGLPSMIDAKMPTIYKLLQKDLQKLKNYSGDLEEELRIKLRKHFSNILGYKPLTLIQVLEK